MSKIDLSQEESNERTVRYYDEFIERQEKVGVNERHQSIAKKSVSRGLKNDHEVLEIGCGIGTLTSLIIPVVTDGHITAVDIGTKNIEVAKERYQSTKNVTFIEADAVEYDFGTKTFDTIILPDVLEHIPFELHNKLFTRLNLLLNERGKVLIHIPNPYHSDWWRALGRPMQIIDLSVHLPIVIENLKNTGLHITYLEIYSVWQEEGEYEFIELQKESKYKDFTTIEETKSFVQKLKEKALYEINKRKRK